MPVVANAAILLAGLLCAACTTAAIEPSALIPTKPQEPTLTATPVAVELPPGGVAATAGNARIRFAPVIGAAREAVTPLSERLVAQASERGIGLVASDDQTASHVMKGYFSTITEGAETTVIFVWDVLDTSGNRVHRIQGQQKEESGGGRGWASVTEPTMQQIAVRTVDELATWLAGSRG